MKTIHLNGNEPGLKALVSASFPSYGGRKFSFRPTNEVELQGGYWDGGSRSSWAAVRLNDGAAKQLPHWDPPQFGGPQGTPKVTLEPGFVIAEHSIFQGKDMGITFYVHPSDAPYYLTAPADVTDDEKIVLAFTRALKNTYGGRTNIRFTEALRKYGITAERWETAQSTCRDKGLLNGRNSITPDGRNIDTGTYRY
jgi:hypothetical protein